MTDDPDLLEDARGIATRYREDDWDVVVLEPTDVRPVDDRDRTGLAVTVSDEEYDLVEGLVTGGEAAFDDAEVYVRAGEDEGRRLVLAVERSRAAETAVVVPLQYELSSASDVFEAALREATLQIAVESAAAREWVAFVHDDPSLFLEDGDLEA